MKLTPKQIALRKKYKIPTIQINKPNPYILDRPQYFRSNGNIDANGTKSIDKLQFKSNTHFIAPAYNKGAYQVCSVNDLKQIGKKL